MQGSSISEIDASATKHFRGGENYASSEEFWRKALTQFPDALKS